ncbi:MAG: MFS transporter [Desulfitobacteriaceae bacterium]
MENTVDKRYIWRVIAAFCLGWAVIYADRTALYPMLNIIGKEFHLTGAQTGAITSAYFFLYVAMQIPAGILGDRIGLKRILVYMYFIAGIGMLATGLFATSYVPLLIFVGLHGLGAGAYYPGAYGTTMNTVPKDMRGLSSGIINSGMSIGLALGLISAGPIYLLSHNWRMPFIILAIPTILIAFLYQFVIKDVRPDNKERVPFSEILKNKNLMLINGAIFCSLYGFWTVVTWGPSFFQNERGLSLTTAGLYTAIIAVVAIPAALTLGRSSDRLGRKKISLILLPLAGITVALMGYVRSLPALVVVLALYGAVGKLTFDPIAVSWTADHVSNTKPAAMGSAVALFNFCGMASSIIAPIVSGWIRDATGSLVTSFYLGGALVVLGAVFVAFVDETVGFKVPKGVGKALPR